MARTNTRLCFNCGSPDHRVDACPSPHDRQRISLSRQLFLFLKDHESASYERIHIASEWNRQRLEWVDMFTPGIIKGDLLQTALGDEEYLKRIALWGYPKGWHSVRDPRELMKEHILTNGENDVQDSTLLMIFGDENESDLEPSSSKDSATAVDFHSRSHSPKLEILPKRWARYPCSYFNSDTLFLYNPRSQAVPFEDSCPLSLLSDQVSTFTPERQRLWEKIISGEVALESDYTTSHAPRRLSNAFSDFAVPDGSNLLSCAPLPVESPPPIPSLPLSPGCVEPELHHEDEENNGVLIRRARPLLKSVSPYGLLFSNPAVDLNIINDTVHATDISGSAICSTDSPVSIASDMDISDTSGHE